MSSFPKSAWSGVSLFVVLAVLLPISSPVNGINFGSISTSLQTLDNKVAVRSLRSLCIIDMKPPFIEFTQCCTLNLPPQGHVVVTFAILQPYRKQIASVDSSKPKYLIGSAVSQFDTPFSMLASSNLLDFSDRLFFDWSKVVWIDLAFLFIWLV